jgi:hypothetical protein
MHEPVNVEYICELDSFDIHSNRGNQVRDLTISDQVLTAMFLMIEYSQSKNRRWHVINEIDIRPCPTDYIIPRQNRKETTVPQSSSILYLVKLSHASQAQIQHPKTQGCHSRKWSQ